MNDSATATAPVYNKNNPFPSKITENRLLNKEGSAKETRHFIVNIKGSGLEYQPGYSLGIFAKNPPSLVAELIEKLKLDAAEQVTLKDGSTKSLSDNLTEDFTLNRVGKKLVQAIADKLPEGADKEKLSAILADKEQISAYIETRDCIDVLNEYPVEFTSEELRNSLGRSVPRLYSIASSQAKHPDEVHLTVAIVRYHTHGRDKKGLATGYLADHVDLNQTDVPVFLAPSKHFKLPETSTNTIMVGPGTGIAPFRAFLEQREIDQATGKNWLFFGDQHQATDFLYEEEFQSWKEKGYLHKLDTAFSRDQEKKVYVQDRMRENGAELWKWLQEGAYFYVCGDAKRMAKDVHQALIDIAIEHGKMETADAEHYINKTLMKEERRYLRDVY